jgi:hypothetical protein
MPDEGNPAFDYGQLLRLDFRFGWLLYPAE